MAGVQCELNCSDALLLGRAATVLRGTHPEERASSETASSVTWDVSRLDGSAANGAGGGTHAAWRVQRQDTGEAFERKGVDAALRCVEFATVIAVVDGPFGLVTLHGALLDRSGKGLLILGPCESGKSTLAVALWRAGWTLLGDDVAAAGPDGGAIPVPRRVSVRHSSRPLLGEPLWSRVLASASCSPTEEGYLFHPSELDDRPPPANTNVAAIVFLARRGVEIGSAEVRRINPAQALLSLAPYSNVIRRSGLADALHRLQPLAQAAPAFDLGRGPLPEMVRAIERLADGVC
jgi:hypothetical protein